VFLKVRIEICGILVSPSNVVLVSLRNAISIMKESTLLIGAQLIRTNTRHIWPFGSNNVVLSLQPCSCRSLISDIRCHFKLGAASGLRLLWWTCG